MKPIKEIKKMKEDLEEKIIAECDRLIDLLKGYREWAFTTEELFTKYDFTKIISFDPLGYPHIKFSIVQYLAKKGVCIDRIEGFEYVYLCPKKDKDLKL